MEFAEVVRRRRMVRTFDPRPVEPALLDRVLARALRAPSAGFSQGVEWVVLEGAGQTAPFWAAATTGDWTGERRQGLVAAPVIAVPLVDRQRYLDRYAEPDKAAVGLDRAEAWPVPYWLVDGAFSTMLLLLACVDEGLGALFFGLHHAGHGGVMDALGIPDRYLPLGAVAMGWPAPDRPSASLARGRRPAAEVIHRGRWSPPGGAGPG